MMVIGRGIALFAILIFVYLIMELSVRWAEEMNKKHK